MEREERRRKKCLNRQSLLAVPRERAAQSSGRITEPVPAGWMTAECLELQRRKGGERETPEPPRSASISEGGSCDESRSLGAMPGWFPLPLDRFPLSPVAISSCRGAARAGREGTIGEVKVSCRQRGL
ncbi:uncharacterized protein O9250_010444 isoform 2-T2 [Rhynochetos jubatus]